MNIVKGCAVWLGLFILLMLLPPVGVVVVSFILWTRYFMRKNPPSGPTHYSDPITRREDDDYRRPRIL